MLVNCHSYYSLNYGCMSVEEVLETSQKLGHTRVALTDINNTSETFRFLKLAPSYGIQPSIGIDFRNGVEQQYVGLAKNNEGFYELNEHLSLHLEQKLELDSRAPEMKNAFIVYPLRDGLDLNQLRSNEYAGVKPEQVKQHNFYQRYHFWEDKLVALPTATFRNKKDYNAHRLLRAIDQNALLSKLEVEQQASANDQYMKAESIYSIYQDYPKMLQNTRELLESCKIEFDFHQPRNNKVSYTNSVEEDVKLLRKLSYQGLPYRYGKLSGRENQPIQPMSSKRLNQPNQPNQRPPIKAITETQPTNESETNKSPGEINSAIIDRLESELKMIEEYNFCAYFLINWDLVRFAQKNNFPFVGRGSGANSMVAYLLRITNVDPIDLDLYFERFINPYRNSPPDFDVDFSWTDREAITTYLFDRYGWDKVVLLGSYQTYQRKAVVRELGKVFGLPDEEIKNLQRLERPANDEYGKLIKKYSTYIEGFPSHLSIHASGILIAEKPIHCYSSTFLPPKNYPTTHFDMQIAEDIGLHKYDILSQRGLGKIKDAVELIMANRQVWVDIDQIDAIKKDERVKNLLREGDLTGCFYVESPAMRMLMTKLRAEDYTRLVAASSIIRPGVAKSGMMREYILRFQDVERREEARKAIPALYEILEETYGVMVYQEDVIKVAHYFAGLSLAQADILRRGMSWKFRERNEFSQVEQEFFDNCRAKGYEEKVILDIWHQIASFANYAFSKGHSASYAVESFQALFLDAYYPLEYLTATLNNGGGFYSRELYVHTARMKGANIELPCVNRSRAAASIQGNSIFLGLGFIRGGFEEANVKAILLERLNNGPFVSFRNFMDRMPNISLEQVIMLIRVGCFRDLEANKKKLLWDAHFLLSESNGTKESHKNLFQVEPKTWQLPPLQTRPLEDAYDEIEFLGFPVGSSPFDLLEEPEKMPDLLAKDLPDKVGQQVLIAGYRVHVKTTKTGNKEAMQFGTFIDRAGRWIDAVLFPDAFRRSAYISAGCYLISGQVMDEFGHISLIVSSIERMSNQNLQND